MYFFSFSATPPPKATGASPAIGLSHKPFGTHETTLGPPYLALYYLLFWSVLKPLSFGEGGASKAIPEAGGGTGGPAGSMPARVRKGSAKRSVPIPENCSILIYTHLFLVW